MYIPISLLKKNILITVFQNDCFPLRSSVFSFHALENIQTAQGGEEKRGVVWKASLKLFCKGSLRQGVSMDFYTGGVTFLDLYFGRIITYFHCEGECFNYKILFWQRCCSTDDLSC